MRKFRPIRNGFDTVIVKPVERPVRLLGGIGKAASDIIRATRRGAKRNRLATPPISPDMNAQQVQRLDQWWKSLPEDVRRDLLDHYDHWIVEQSIIAERQAEINGGKKQYWSLSGSRKHRKEALSEQKGTYHIWLSVLGVGIITIVVISLIRQTTPMFFLMSAMFLALIVPDVMRQRLTRAQLMYGRRISFREFLKPLPFRMHVDETHEAMYQAALKTVMSGSAHAGNPVTERFYHDEHGYQYRQEREADDDDE